MPSRKSREPTAVAPPPPDATHKPNILVLRGSVEWRDWLKRAAKADRTTVAEFIDRACVQRAKRNGFVEPPPDR